MNRQQLLEQLVDNLQNMYRGMQHRHDFTKENIPFGQKAALFTIALHYPINVKQLAHILHVTSGAATQHVEALVREQLVERTVDATDRRSVNIVLSPKGKKLMKQLEQNRLAMLEELFGDITNQELAAYNQVMQKVNIKLK